MKLAAVILACAIAVVPLTAADPKPKDPLVGTWHGVIAEQLDAWPVTMVVKGSGKILSGGLLGWTAIPEDVAMLVAKGGTLPRDPGYVNPRIYSENLLLTRRDGQVLAEGQDLHKLVGSGNLSPDLFGLSEQTPGLLTGTIVDKTGKPGKSIVLLCSDACWTKPSLPPPPAGQTTAIDCLGCSYHYRVYVPKGYDPAKPAPLVVHTNPGGNAGPLSTALADEFGWVMIGLTEARNGEWLPVVQNREAALFDIRQRLAIDWRRVFFGGDSGGARASSLSAITRPDICAGLLLSIASYPDNVPPHPRIPIFFITGDKDMNLAEVERAYNNAKAAKRPTELIRHQGGHENGGQANIDAALRWLHDHAAPYGAPAAPAAPAKR